MNRIGTALGAFTLALLTAASASAQIQTVEGPEGLNEITTFALLSTTFGDDAGASMSALFFTYGKYLTDRDQVAAGPRIFITRAAGSTDASVGMTASYRRFLSAPDKEREMIPYFGGEVMLSDLTPPVGASVGDLTFINAIGGFKYFFIRELGLDIKGAFGFSPGGAGQSLQMTVGLSYRF